MGRLALALAALAGQYGGGDAALDAEVHRQTMADPTTWTLLVVLGGLAYVVVAVLLGGWVATEKGRRTGGRTAPRGSPCRPGSRSRWPSLLSCLSPLPYDRAVPDRPP
jgi:heme A synthase